MKIDLTYKEANLLNAILWELGEERGVVLGNGVWRLSTKGEEMARGIADKLEAANDEVNRVSGKDRDLSLAPKNTIIEATWKS